MTKVQLVKPEISSNSGTTYFVVDLALRLADGTPVTRKAAVLVNPRWAGAQEEAIKNKTRNKQPTMNILVQDMEREEGNYDGTGSVWQRRKGLHSGSFAFDNVQYTATVTRLEAKEGEEVGPLEFTLEEVKPVNIADL